MRAHVEAYGCTLNFGEAREIEGLLAARGWEIVSGADECDLNVIATCVVVEKTEKATLSRLTELKDAPRLIVTGCEERGLATHDT
jgi:tRNA A37 methylthiotransferase MiaB